MSFDAMSTYKFNLIGTTVLIKLFEKNDQAINCIYQKISQLESLLSANSEHSELMQLNALAGIRPLKVSPILFDLVAQAKATSLLSHSRFNCMIGPLVKLWKIGFGGRCVPSESAICAALDLIDPTQILLDPSNRSLYLTQKGMEIDLGGIAKGYIADIIKSLLQSFQIHHALVDMGSNIFALGYNHFSEDGLWKVGLRQPFGSKEDMVGYIKISNECVTTSGIYERYFQIDHKIYHHIIDPLTGYPLENDLSSVTVISASSLQGEIYSSLLFGMGLEKGLLAVQQHPEIQAVFINRKNQKIEVFKQNNVIYSIEM